jgi:hypothetical protein
MGAGALLSNTSGTQNTATGSAALSTNNIGNSNTATGSNALRSNTGNSNTAMGAGALSISTGSNNIALGSGAGSALTSGDNNIDIGAPGVLGESNKIRIGKQGTQNGTFIAGISGVNEGGTISPVYINTNGRLGTQPPASSHRYKKEIKPMDKASEAILSLKPVTFCYKSDDKDTPQFGLIAEEVAEVNPDLIVRDDKGEIYTVRYEAVNAMLLNEFLKEHRKVEQQNRKLQGQEATIAQIKEDFQSKITEQQQEIKALATGLEKVSAQVEMSKAAPRMVVNDR